MIGIAENLFAESQALDGDERVALAEKLIGSVALESGVFSSHLTVAYAHLEEILAGEVTPVSREDTLKQVQELLRKGSAA